MDDKSTETKRQSLRICLGVTGSIAAYKACELVRLFIKEGHEVAVVMTQAATEFVTPLTFQTLSRRPVCTGLFDPLAAWEPEHIALSDWCDAFVVAPCTANVLAKMAHGLADDALSASLLACDRPVIVAPAMNVKMWQHAATQANVATLRNRGVDVIRPGTGELACGVTATGRMPEPSEIMKATLVRLGWSEGDVNA